MYKMYVERANLELALVVKKESINPTVSGVFENEYEYWVDLPKNTPNYLNLGLSMLRKYSKFKFIDRDFVIGDKVKLKKKFIKNMKRAIEQGFFGYVNLKYKDKTVKLPLNLILMVDVDVTVKDVKDDYVIVEINGQDSIDVNKEFIVLDGVI